MKKTYTVEGMHCTSCALLIEGELEDIGVAAKVDYAKSAVSVEFDDTEVKEQDIISAVKKAGYSLES